MEYKKILTTCLIVSILIIVLIGWGMSSMQKAGNYWERYHQLRIGMTYEQVRTIWGNPYATIRIPDRGEVWCYRNEGHPIHIGNKIFLVKESKRSETSMVLQKLEDIQEIYSEAELLFNIEGQLEAFTSVGEETYVHTARGDLEGSSLRIYAKHK